MLLARYTRSLFVGLHWGGLQDTALSLKGFDSSSSWESLDQVTDCKQNSCEGSEVKLTAEISSMRTSNSAGR